MKKLFAVWLMLCASLAFGHDLTLTQVKIVRENGRTQIVLITPISKLLKAESLGSKPDAANIDLVIRRRLILLEEGRRLQPVSTCLDLDSQNDILRWTCMCDSIASKVSIGGVFYPEDSASKTYVGYGDHSQLLQRSLSGQPSSNKLKLATSSSVGKTITTIGLVAILLSPFALAKLVAPRLGKKLGNLVTIIATFVGMVGCFLLASHL